MWEVLNTSHILNRENHKQPDVVNIHMSMIIESYLRLLADIRDLSGLPLGAPDEVSYEWVLKEGPKLEKHCLAYIEGREI
jgi:hypothetical protein